MLKKLYIGLFDFGFYGNVDTTDFLEELTDTNNDYSNFVVVEAVSEDDAKRKILNSTRKLDIENSIDDIAEFIINLYDQNVDNSKYFSTLEKLYDTHIGDEPINDLFDMPISKRKALFQDISTLDKSILNEIHFWLWKGDIYITDKFKQIAD